jgi:hypothetical protein
VSDMPESRSRSSAAYGGCEEVPGTTQHHQSSTVVIAFPKRMAPRPAIHLPAALLLAYALRSFQCSKSSFYGDECSLISGLDQVAPACTARSVTFARELAKKSSAALLRKIRGGACWLLWG